MSNSIPAAGSFALLNALTDFVPDDFINASWPIPWRRGPRFRFSAEQLWRVHLLSVLMGGWAMTQPTISTGLPRLHKGRSAAAVGNKVPAPKSSSCPPTRMKHFSG
jgi:hypothetical protein